MNKLTKTDAKDVGDAIGINWDEVSLDEFTQGINVEFEHGSKYPKTNITKNDKKMTGKIAWAHLKEFPDYYTRLAKMEKKATEFWKKKANE